jgi:hypothetical protein
LQGVPTSIKNIFAVGFSDLSRLAQAHAAEIRGELIDWIETAGKSCSNAGYPASIII